MPRLYTDEPDKFWKVGDKEYRIDKENSDCIYSDEEHVYINKKDNSRYISVTTLINKYSEEFDEDFWSSYKALEEIIDGDTFSILKKALLATKKFNPKILKKFQIDEELFAQKKAEIIAQYNATRNEACEHGTTEHLRKELSFYGKHNFDFDRYGYKDLSGEYDCKKNYYELDLERGVYPEFLIAVTSRDGILKVSGQIDCLIKNGNEITILDWKTNREIKKESYYNRSTKQHQMMKFPLNNIQDSNYWHYALQLSLYAYLLQTLHPEFVIKGLKLIHIDREQKETEYEVPYLKDDVERMLKHYKRQLKIEQELDRLKPAIE